MKGFQVMSCYKKNVSGARPVVRSMAVLWSALAALLIAPAALAIDTGDIVVVSLKGEVHVTMNGAVRNVRAGGVLELPASIRTGRDGSIELSQGATSVNVGPETLLEFPALEKRGAPIDRIVQPRGNAFYSIGKREGRKLRVETPYLVGVIKGTQFNVAAQDDSTTISLFEGLLEVRATDDSDVVDLKAGEIASRKRGDKSISVMKMDGAKAPPTAPRQPAGSGSNNGTPGPVAPRVTPSNEGGESLLVDRGGGTNTGVAGVVDTVNGTGAAVGASASVGSPGGADVAVDAAANVGDAVDVRANAAVNAGAGGIDVSAGTRVDAGPVSVDAGAAVNLGGGSLDVSTSTSVNAGPVSVDTGAAVNLGGGAVDVSTSTSIDAGPVAVDVAGSAGVDVGAGTVDTSVSTGVDAGPLTTDVGASAAVDVGAGTVATSVDLGASAPVAVVDVGATTAVDLGAGTVAAGVDLGASAPVAVVDVGATAGVNVGAGTIDLGLTVAGTDLGLGIDLGLDDSKPSTDTTTPTTPVVDVGGLLDGLFHRRKK